ncbi:unnamed protein product [Paramecium sonneborni]|uniref:Uncharacterized protein n=1 Tax=Paramecium sonneborni TaxID=65129 RepID=A0A8S1R481_9CILI|nr:unnamed protein product [Paramecium sonneborni]
MLEDQRFIPEQEKKLDLLDVVDRLKDTKYNLQMRFIPLIKVAPYIPTEKQQSHNIKLIELFYTENLQRKIRFDIESDMVGFVL